VDATNGLEETTRVVSLNSYDAPFYA